MSLFPGTLEQNSYFAHAQGFRLRFLGNGRTLDQAGSVSSSSEDDTRIYAAHQGHGEGRRQQILSLVYNLKYSALLWVSVGINN